MKKPGKTGPWKLLCIDLMLASVLLLTFAYFDHVRPDTSVDEQPGMIISGDEDSSFSVDFSSRFPDVFTDGEIVEDQYSYRSANVSVTFDELVVEVEKGKAVCYLFDIYVRSPEFFRTSLLDNTLHGGYYHRIDTLTHARNNDAIMAINGDYCVARDQGIVVRNGVLYRTEPFEDILVMYTNGTMKTFEEGDYDDIDFSEENVWQVWSFGPALLDNGQPKTRFDSTVSKSNPRSAVGYYEPGHYCIVAVDGRDMGGSEGMTLRELAQFFHELGCEEAYNLDGGKTSVAVFGDRVVNIPYSGGRDCSDIIYIPRG